MAQKSTASVSSEKGEAIAATNSTTSDTPEPRDEVASKLVDRFAMWSGVAGLIPLPIVDIIAVGGLQLQMLRRLSQIYDVSFSENSGKALIASLAGSMIPATSGIGAASVLKAVPIFGTMVAGFVMPVLSAGATYAIGKAFIQHFAIGWDACLISILRTIVSSSRPRRRMWDSRRAPANARGQRQLLTRTAVCQPIGEWFHSERDSVTDETEPHARIHRLRDSAFSRDFAASNAEWVFRDVSPRACHHSVVVLPVLLITGPSRRVEWRRRT